MASEQMTEEEAFNLYSEEANRAPQGAPRLRKSKLSEVVPVRLSEETMNEIKRRSGETGQSVSGWIREALSEKLEEVEPGAGKSAYLMSEAASSLLTPVALGRSVTVDPSNVFAKLLVIWAREVTESVSASVGQIERELASRPIEALLETPQVLDAHAIRYRGRSHFGPLVELARAKKEELDSAQRALLTVFRASRTPAFTADQVRDVRERVAAVRSELNKIGWEAVEASKTVRASMWSSREAFIQSIEQTRKMLRQLDEDLYVVEADSAPASDELAE